MNLKNPGGFMVHISKIMMVQQYHLMLLLWIAVSGSSALISVVAVLKVLMQVFKR